MNLRVQSLASLSGLRIPSCCELWYSLQTWLGSDVAVAVAVASSCSSDSTPSLGISICCALKKKKKKKGKKNRVLVYVVLYVCVCLASFALHYVCEINPLLCSVVPLVFSIPLYKCNTICSSRQQFGLFPVWVPGMWTVLQWTFSYMNHRPSMYAFLFICT